ncbi:MAG TPA: DUF2169 domain-containing protein [Planctomycetota bacterium]|nr:DUF2169 domain-containing protein [Planctomycetota bacterium]
MKILTPCGFPLAVIPGKIRPPEWTATCIVKASFALRPDGPAAPLPEPVPFSGDVLRDEEMLNDPLYDSDFSPWKPNADVMLTGTCHAPGQKPTTACRVEFAVGKWSKALAVIGNRHWKKSLLMSAASDPEPFQRLGLTYGNAYGGEGFERNPIGRGYEKAFLPNVEPLEDRISSPGDRPEPSGYGPLNRQWPQRASKTGSYRGKWLRERWPFLPDDFDFSYFNAAPEDQQFRKYLRGDEELRFEHLHPKHSVYKSALPGIRIRVFLSEKAKDGKRFREVPMNLDTLFVDMDKEIVILVWRGNAPVRNDEMTELEQALAVSEPLKDAPAPPSTYEALLLSLDPPPPPPAPKPAPASKPPGPMQLELQAAKENAAKLEAAHLEGARALAKQAGFDLDAAMAKPAGGIPELRQSLLGAKEAYQKMGAKVPGLLEAEIAALAPGGQIDVAVQKFQVLNVPKAAKAPVTPELLKAAAAKPGGLRGKDMSGASLSGADFSGQDLSGVLLKGADLSRAKLVKAVLRGSQLSGANLAGADLSGAVLEKADLTRANLAGAKLEGALLARADLSGVAAPGAVFSGVQAPKSFFTGANLEGAAFGKALLTEADLSRTNVKGAKFGGALLAKASFAGSKGEGADFTEADMTETIICQGADFKKAVFAGVSGPQSVWIDSVLDGADFSGARLIRSNFLNASLKQVKLIGADVKNSTFRKAGLLLAEAMNSDFHESSFAKANLSGADFNGSNLFGADLYEAVLEGAKLKGANLHKTLLA